MIDTELSPFGRERRDQILNMAIQHARQRRRRRLTIRGGVVAITLLVIGAVALRVHHSASHPDVVDIGTLQQPSVEAPHNVSAAKVAIEHIQTDPTIVRRFAIPPSPPRWQRLDDDHLLQELAQAGKPAGLIKIDGQATLVFHRPSR